MISTMYFLNCKMLPAVLLSAVMLAGAAPVAVAEAAHFDYANQAAWREVYGERQSPIALDSDKEIGRAHV